MAQDVKNFPRIDDIKVHFEKLDGTKYEAKPIKGDTVTTSTNETSNIASDEQSFTSISIPPSQSHEELRSTTNTGSGQTESEVHKFIGEYELQVESESTNIRLVARTSYGYEAQYEFTIPLGKT